MERELLSYLQEVAKHLDGWEAVYVNLSAFLKENGGCKIYVYPYQQKQQKRIRIEVSWHYEGEPLGQYILKVDREQNYTVTAKADTHTEKLARRLMGDLIPRYLEVFYRYRDEHFERQERQKRSQMTMKQLAEFVGARYVEHYNGFSQNLGKTRIDVRAITSDEIEFQVQVSNDRALELLKTLEAIGK